MVRLLQWAQLQAQQQRLTFQSHNGAIATEMKEAVEQGLRSFNPTMVRLLPTIAVPIAAIDRRFQYHNGAIATQLLTGVAKKDIEFQSHNGAIATILRQIGFCWALGFNPTMVRLLHNDVMRRSILLAVFQSHNGAIATGVI